MSAGTCGQALCHADFSISSSGRQSGFDPNPAPRRAASLLPGPSQTPTPRCRPCSMPPLWRLWPWTGKAASSGGIPLQRKSLAGRRGRSWDSSAPSSPRCMREIFGLSWRGIARGIPAPPWSCRRAAKTAHTWPSGCPVRRQRHRDHGSDGRYHRTDTGRRGFTGE